MEKGLCGKKEEVEGDAATATCTSGLAGARSLAWGWDVLFKSRRAMPKGGS
jgi:hypothetical protein